MSQTIYVSYASVMEEIQKRQHTLEQEVLSRMTLEELQKVRSEIEAKPNASYYEVEQ